MPSTLKFSWSLFFFHLVECVPKHRNHFTTKITTAKKRYEGLVSQVDYISVKPSIFNPNPVE